MHLGATELLHSVTPTVSGYIYSREKIWKLLQTPSPMHCLLCLQGLRIIDFVASRLQSLVSATVNGIQPRHCRRSEFIAKLGYGLDHNAIPV